MKIFLEHSKGIQGIWRTSRTFGEIPGIFKTGFYYYGPSAEPLDRASPQYHIAFYDKFETVFANGKKKKNTDKTCQKSWLQKNMM